MPEYKEIVINATIKPTILLTDFLKQSVNASAKSTVISKSNEDKIK